MSARLFNGELVIGYLDAIRHRVERETKVIDLRLRIDPFPAALAAALDPDVGDLLFLEDGTPHPNINAIDLALEIPAQRLAVYPAPDVADPSIVFVDAAIAKVRARAGDGGYALLMTVTIGPLGAGELAYVAAWLTEARFLSCAEQQPGLDFAAPAAGVEARA